MRSIGISGMKKAIFIHRLIQFRGMDQKNLNVNSYPPT